jgi:hypothetical protein
MMRKGQVKRLDGGDSTGQVKLVEGLFGVAAELKLQLSPFALQVISCDTTGKSVPLGKARLQFSCNRRGQ